MKRESARSPSRTDPAWAPSCASPSFPAPFRLSSFAWNVSRAACCTARTRSSRLWITVGSVTPGTEIRNFCRNSVSVPGVTDPTVIHNRDDLVRAVQQAARETFQAKLDNLKGMEKDVEAQLGAQAGSVRLGERALSRFMLGVIDEKWKDHLYDLDQL